MEIEIRFLFILLEKLICKQCYYINILYKYFKYYNILDILNSILNKM